MSKLFCTKCGTENTPDSAFCMNCGQALVRAAAQAPSQPEPVSTNTAQHYVTLGHNMRAAQMWGDAVEYYKKAANMNDAEGLYWLGNCVLTGHGAKKDEFLACQLYSLAAKQDHAQAKDHLFMYLNAIMDDTAKNQQWAELAPFLKLGVEIGHVRSIYVYGLFWTAGIGGFPVNKQEGYKWIKIAADNGWERAKKDLKELF